MNLRKILQLQVKVSNLKNLQLQVIKFEESTSKSYQIQEKTIDAVIIQSQETGPKQLC